MSIDLHITRQRVQARVPGAAEAWRARLKQVSREPLSEALSARLGVMAATLGLRPDAEIRVRQVRVRLRLRGQVSAHQLAEAWAEVLARDLERQLSSLASQGGGWTERVALFADPQAATLTWLARRLQDAPVAWWEAEVARDRTPGEALQDVAYAVPDRFAPALLALVRAATRPWEAVCSRPETDVLVRLLRRAIVTGTAWGSRPPPPTPHGIDAAQLFSVLDHWAGVSAPGLEGVAEPTLRRLLITCRFICGDMPPSSVLPHARVETPETASRTAPHLPGASGSPQSPGALPYADQTRPDGSSSLEANALPTSRPAPEERLEAEAEQTAADSARPLYLLGLPFLIRPLLRSPYAADLPLTEQAALISDVIDAALRRLLEGLTLREAQLVRDQHAELIYALTNDAPPADEARGDRVLDELLGTLPLEVADVLFRAPLLPARKALALRLHDTAPDGLKRLVLRPGRLTAGRGWVDLYLPLTSVDLALRLGGWDLDPGWVPCLGRVLRFHYEEAA